MRLQSSLRRRTFSTEPCRCSIARSPAFSLASRTGAGRRRRGRRRAPTRPAPASAPASPRRSSAAPSWALVASSSARTCAGTTHWSCESKLASDLEEAFAGGHLDGDRRGEADHGGAAQPHVGAAAALLRALLAPDGQRPGGRPGGDGAPLAGGDAQRRRCCILAQFSEATSSTVNH